MVYVPFSLADTHGYPLSAQVTQLHESGESMNAARWWLEAVIAGWAPTKAYNALLEAHNDSGFAFLSQEMRDAKMTGLYSLAGGGKKDPECWHLMLAHLTNNA